LPWAWGDFAGAEVALGLEGEHGQGGLQQGGLDVTATTSGVTAGDRGGDAIGGGDAVPADAGDDESGAFGAQPGRIQTHLGQDAGTEILDDHVGMVGVDDLPLEEGNDATDAARVHALTQGRRDRVAVHPTRVAIRQDAVSIRPRCVAGIPLLPDLLRSEPKSGTVDR
jgi:hypothetical protein